MMENLKKYATQTLVLMINVALVGGGVSYFKKQQDQKNIEAGLAASAPEIAQAPAVDPVAEKAQQLQQIIDKNSKDKTATVKSSPANVPVQVPKTVTQTIPGGTKTVTTTSPSSTKTSSTPAKTTKKS